MAQTTRTFLAIDVPSNLADRMTKLQHKLAPLAPDFRWVDAIPFHLTLAFLGDVPFAELNEICEVARQAARACKRFEVQVAGLGAFPKPERPRVVWAGFAGPGLEPLAALHGEIVSGLRRIGRPPEDARFTPHVTLGRLKPGAGRGKTPSPAPDLSAIVSDHRQWSPGALTVGEVVAYSSTITPEGPTYAALARAPLASAKARVQT
jgi:2'-5' RNA ligase